MADRNLVTFEEERLEHGPHWTLQIDRSSAGQPGLLFTIKTEMHSEADKQIESLNQEMTIVGVDGVALLAPVLTWLTNDDLVEEVAKARYERAPGLDFTRGWEGAPDDVQGEFREMVRSDIQALIHVGQARLNEQYRVGRG